MDEVESTKRALLDTYYAPYNMAMPQRVLDAFAAASAAEPGTPQRAELLRRAKDKAEMAYYGMWTRGEIRKAESVPMPDDIKKKLREINDSRRAEKAARRMEIDRADTVIKTKTKPGIKAKLGTSTKIGKKKPKVSLYLDANRQAEMVAKYPWVKTFRQDPDKEGQTLIDIKCTNCDRMRTVHAADAWQVKKCLDCR